MPPPLTSLQKFLPLLCMTLLAAVFANAAYHQVSAIPQFLFVLREWGFESLETRRMVARGVIAFEFVCTVLLFFAVGTGITDNRRFGFVGWRFGRYAVLGLLVYLQLTIVLYAANDPLFCGCGPLTLRLDGIIEDFWYWIGFSEPIFIGTIPIARNVFLSLLALIALTRGRVKKPHE